MSKPVIYIDNTVCHKFIEFYSKHYLGKSGLTFLDIGCGKDGPFSKYIADHKNKVVAIDVVNELPCTEYIMSIKANIFELGFVPNSFDCVIDSGCLQLFPKKEVIELYKKIKKWLKSDGRFYTKTAAESPYYKRVKSRISTEDELIRMFEGGGL